MCNSTERVDISVFVASLKAGRKVAHQSSSEKRADFILPIDGYPACLI